MTNSNQLCYTVKQARELIGGVSHSFFYSLIKSGQVKTFKIGHRTMIAHSDLQALIESLKAA